MANAIQVAEFRKRRKQLLIDVMGGKCCLCGYNKCNAVLEFHHLNPQEKLYQLSSGNCHSLEQDLQEARKCILVCANCHREIHNGFYNDVVLTTSYQKELGEQLLLEKEAKQYRPHYCIDCGIEINKNSTRCVKCEGKRRKKSNKKLVSREELKKLIRTESFVSIGAKYGVTDNAIRKWCDNYNLPRTKKEINSYTDAQWVEI